MFDLVLLLRYSDYNGIDTITAHKRVIERYGTCWWAKIGKQPSSLYLSAFINQKHRCVMLYTSGILYECKIGRIIYQRPSSKYPEYYERDIFGSINEPKTYFELLSIEKINVSILNDYLVRSSGKPVIHDLKKTVCSYMMIQSKDAPLPEKKSKPKKTKKVVYDYSHCTKKVEGICKHKYCVYYDMVCTYENTCRKIIPLKCAID